MATFRVGMRVRVNCPESSDHRKETRITRLYVNGMDRLGRTYVGHEVDIALRLNPSRRCIYELHELEPILPPARTLRGMVPQLRPRRAASARGGARMKFCVDCRYHTEYQFDLGRGGTKSIHSCSHPSLVNPVTGAKETARCDDRRSSLACGREGKQFEAKEVSHA